MNSFLTRPKDSSVEEKQLQRTHAKEDWVTAGLSLFPRLLPGLVWEGAISREALRCKCAGTRAPGGSFWKQLHHHHEALRAAESVKGKLYLEMKTTKHFGACRWILQEGGWGGEVRCNRTVQIPGWPRLLQRLCIWAQKWEQLLNAAHHATI